MSKPTLVLFPGFGTNTIILEGVHQYLSEFFTVVPIDPPGFSPQVPPLSTITVEDLTKAAQQKVAELEIDNFIIGGISFGFLLANACAVDSRCAGVLAFGPYINQASLQHTTRRLRTLKLLTQIFQTTKFDTVIWGSDTLFKTLWQYLNNGNYHYTFDILRKTIDRRTLVSLSKELLVFDKALSLVDKPYALVMNPNDVVVSYEVAKKALADAQQLHIFETELEHFPDRFDKEYVEQYISNDGMQKVVDYFAQHTNV